jgi:hypothetical protein
MNPQWLANYKPISDAFMAYGWFVAPFLIGAEFTVVQETADYIAKNPPARRRHHRLLFPIGRDSHRAEWRIRRIEMICLTSEHSVGMWGHSWITPLMVHKWSTSQIRSTRCQSGLRTRHVLSPSPAPPPRLRPSSRSKCRMPAQKPRQVISLASARPATNASASEATAVKGLIGPFCRASSAGREVFSYHRLVPVSALVPAHHPQSVHLPNHGHYNVGKASLPPPINYMSRHRRAGWVLLLCNGPNRAFRTG